MLGCNLLVSTRTRAGLDQATAEPDTCANQNWRQSRPNKVLTLVGIHEDWVLVWGRLS